MQHDHNISVSEEMKSITGAAASFIENVRFSDVPKEARHIGIRCILDGLGLMVAGTDEETVTILVKDTLRQGGREEALLLGCGQKRVPADKAARILGCSVHAHDWDDTQVSRDPDHVYGLLTHPTATPLASALAVSQELGGVNGREFLLAFLTGFEVECKIAEWMLPHHYKRGMHSTGTVGTFAAYAAAAKLMGLRGKQLRCGIGIAASMAAGIRANFGTMSKPLHVGKAAENGVLAARLASCGFTADLDALDGRWGFFAVHGDGVSNHKVQEGFGKVWSIVDPGVSIKPYPCGVLTHPSMDLMLRLVRENDLRPEQIDSVTLFAGSNILNPIRYHIAVDHLQAKFSLPAELAMVILQRRAGKQEFSDEFVRSEAMQKMQRRIITQHDEEIEKAGFDRIRSRIEVRLKNGDIINGTADERYRGGPENPLTDGELEEKVRACCEGILDPAAQRKLLHTAWHLLECENTEELALAIQSDILLPERGQ